MLGVHSVDLSSEIKGKMKEALRKKLKGSVADMDLDSQLNTMTKAEMMDSYLCSFRSPPGAAEICQAVEKSFGIDLEAAPVLPQAQKHLQTTVSSAMSPSRTAIHSYLADCGPVLTGDDARTMINHLFGVNLTAISALEKARISLYSKGQWIIQHDTDLFVVDTANKDADVRVSPTEYFIKQTGLHALPVELQRALSRLGFCCDKQTGSYYFSNPDGQAVSDSFKGQTMRAIGEVIQQQLSHL